MIFVVCYCFLCEFYESHFLILLISTLFYVFSLRIPFLLTISLSICHKQPQDLTNTVFLLHELNTALKNVPSIPKHRSPDFFCFPQNKYPCSSQSIGLARMKSQKTYVKKYPKSIELNMQRYIFMFAAYWVYHLCKYGRTSSHHK